MEGSGGAKRRASRIPRGMGWRAPPAGRPAGRPATDWPELPPSAPSVASCKGGNERPAELVMEAAPHGVEEQHGGRRCREGDAHGESPLPFNPLVVPPSCSARVAACIPPLSNVRAWRCRAENLARSPPVSNIVAASLLMLPPIISARQLKTGPEKPERSAIRPPGAWQR